MKILRTKTYKCPKCQCRWEVVKPALPDAPTNQTPVPAVSQPVIQQPSVQTEQPLPSQTKQPATSAVNDYYGMLPRPSRQQLVPQPPIRRQARISQPLVARQIVLPPIVQHRQTDSQPEFSVYEGSPNGSLGQTFSIRDMLKKQGRPVLPQSQANRTLQPSYR